ncbi:mechanosensitive ion channel domain-containing protein [uncultured Roseibium sp.]|uniref:mechanosensitive ion channel family protein n=1 Tax=uncultured Roseibium sp. TaxID=1936171 RepID=UPI00261117EE|nr:mechanosensitive ion channel domain-containing protein [uncultured Roseibium sp.]
MASPIVTAQVSTPADTQPETAEAIIEDVTSGLSPIVEFVVDTTVHVADQLLSYQGLYQVGLIAGCATLAWLAARPARQMVAGLWPTSGESKTFLRNAFLVVQRLIFPAILALLLWIGATVFRSLGTGNDLVRLVASLLQAWILIRLFSAFVRDPLWSRTFATIAWLIAALNILRLLNPTIAILDNLALSFGETRLSVYMVIKGVIIFGLLVWVASLVSRFIQARVNQQGDLTPSVRTLISQSVRIAMFFAAIMFAMNAIGVDLTAFAVFSGAVGVGIGFGLQAIFSNLVAGIIILFERSITVGDFVELESGLTGEVREINIRSTRVTTNDNVDILVPNSEFINNRVTNWTLHENFKRTRIPFGVAYGTDKELVRKAALEAASSVPHMLTGDRVKPPEVWLVGFGESSLDFELVVWLKPESVSRPAKVSADYNWALETALTKYGIEIPFPQRDLHIRSSAIPIKLSAESESEN